jgi:hypothetical protein
MSGVVEELSKALEAAANDIERDMLKEYIEHFKVSEGVGRKGGGAPQSGRRPCFDREGK